MGGWYREWEEKALRPMEFELCSLHVGSSNSPKFMYLCSVLYVLYYISSLCSGGFAVCDCRHVLVRCVLGHGTDVTWTGMCTSGFGNSTHLLLRVAGRWRSTSLRWCSVIHTCHANAIHLIYIGAYTYKYIGHETANWLGCDGRRSEHCRRCG